MPDKTHGELIRELLVTATSLTERTNNFATELTHLEERVSKINEQVVILDKKVAIHEHQIEELRDERKETGEGFG